MSFVNKLFVNNNAVIVGDLDVNGTTTASSFISNGGLPSEFVKGDGSLDPSVYVTNPSFVNFQLIDAGLITNSIKNDDDAFTINLTTASIHNGTGNVLSVDSTIEAYTFNKIGGTNIQYLMADGSTLTQSATSGNSNFYLYNNTNSTTEITPVSGEVIINSISNSTATVVYISHVTRDNIDVEVFWKFVNKLTELYLQDQTLSNNYIQYNITAAPTITVGNKIAIPVVVVNSAGTGATSFGAGHNILVSFFSNNLEVDTRLSSLEQKTTSITYGAGLTEIGGTATVIQSRLFAGVDDGNFELLMNAGTISMNSDIINTNRAITCETLNALNIINGGSSLTKNNFNTSQSVGPIGFKDNWFTATGNNASIKQNMIYMENVGRVIVISISTPQYFNDATGVLTNITNGLSASGSFLYIPELSLIYSKNATQYSTSTDGITWTIPANLINGGTAVNNAIVYGNGLYVCASGSGANLIQTSTDGITWVDRPATRNIYNIVYTGTKFITFGSAGCMLSTDGITWVNDTIQLNNIRASIYCASLGCIIAQIQGSNRNIIVSYDSGLSWTTLANIFPFNISPNIFIWDNGLGKAYALVDELNNTYIYNSSVFEFDASGIPALGGSIQMMGSTSSLASSGLTYYIYNPIQKRFLFTRNESPHKVFYSTTSNNLAVSANQYVIGSLNCSGGFNPYGLANIDIMLRDTPFIGIQYINNSGNTATISNSLWTALGSTSSTGSTYALTNNFTRQLCSASWTTVALANGAGCGFASTTTGARVSRGFNFGLSAVLGISDIAYNANNCQNFFGLWNLSTQIPLNQTTQLSVQRNMVCFGSDTDDTNICIYTAGVSSTVKQVDLGVSFPANRPAGSSSTDWFKFTIYWDTTKFFYKAVNTTANVVVSGTFTALAADIPAINIILFPQCVRIMGTPQTNGQSRLQVQRFGVYY